MLGCNSVLIGHFEMDSIDHDLQKGESNDFKKQK